jgi:hypothetical protein
MLTVAVCWWLPAQSPKKAPSAAAPSAKKNLVPTPAPEPPPPLAPPPAAPPAFSEKLTYGVEWRLIRAGTVTIEARRGHHTLRLDSAGIVSALLKIQDTYNVDNDDPFCATSSVMDSMEGKRHHETRVTFDRAHNHTMFVERDLIANKVLSETGTEIPNCASDVINGITRLRSLNLSAGQSVQIPVSDGRRFANVKLQAIEREEIKTPSGTYQAMRYQADLMNGVVYGRKGQVFLWLSEESRKLPVQIQLKMNFPVGTVTLQLEKEEHP